MPAEDWELRREARRCIYAAEHAETPGGRRMMEGYARFYEALAQTSEESGPKASLAVRRTPLKPLPRDLQRRRSA